LGEDLLFGFFPGDDLLGMSSMGRQALFNKLQVPIGDRQVVRLGRWEGERASHGYVSKARV